MNSIVTLLIAGLISAPAFSSPFVKEGEATYKLRPSDTILTAYNKVEDMAVQDAMSSLPVTFLDKQKSLLLSAPWLISGGSITVEKISKSIKQCANLVGDDVCAYMSVRVEVDTSQIQFLAAEIIKNDELHYKIQKIINADLNVDEMSVTEKEWQSIRKKEVLDQVLSISRKLGSVSISDQLSEDKTSDAALAKAIKYRSYINGLRNNIQLSILGRSSENGLVTIEYEYNLKDTSKFNFKELVELMGGDYVMANKFAYRVFNKASDNLYSPHLYALFPQYVEGKRPALLYVTSRDQYFEFRTKHNVRNDVVTDEVCKLYSNYKGFKCSRFGAITENQVYRYSLATNESEFMVMRIFEQYFYRDKDDSRYARNRISTDIPQKDVVKLSDIGSLSLNLDFLIDDKIVSRQPFLLVSSPNYQRNYESLILLKPEIQKVSFKMPENTVQHIEMRLSFSTFI